MPIKKLTKIFLVKNFTIITILLSIASLIKILEQYFNADIVGGWDGTSHFAISENYFKNIFPDLYGWTHNYYAGMPWPIGYNPLFHILFASLRYVTHIDGTILFKILFSSIIIIMPALIYFLAKNLKYKNFEAFFISLLAIFFLNGSEGLFGTLGLNSESAFKSGLYMQTFASFLLIIWLIFFVNLQNAPTRKNFFLSTLFLSFTILSNIHVGEVALIIYGIVFFVDIFFQKKYYLFKFYLLNIILSATFISFWSFPLIETLRFFPNQTFEPPPLKEYIAIIGLLFSTTWAGYFLLKEKNIALIKILLSALSITLLGTLPIYKLFPNLPVQQGRLLPYSILLSLLIFPYSVIYFTRKYKISKLKSFLVLLPLIIPFLIFFKIPSFNKYELLYTDDEKNIVEYLQAKTDGRSLFEVISDNYPTHYNLSALSGLSKHQTAWSVFRESSLNSTFIPPLRNIFSVKKEYYAVSCYLCEDGWEEFYKVNEEKLLKRLNLYNISYIIARTVNIKEKLEGSTNFNRLADFELWSIFETKSPHLYAEIPENKPALLFTDLNSKKRDFDGEFSYNWLRYGEEWFSMSDFSIQMVKGDSNSLESSDLVDFFDIIIIEEIKIKDENALRNLFEKYSENKHFFIIESDSIDENFLYIAKNDKYENVHFLQKSNDFKKDYEELINIITPFIKKQSKLIEIDSVQFGKNSINIDGQKLENQEEVISTIDGRNSSDEGTFILVKSSYFPYWQDKNGGIVMMSFPSLTMVYSDKEDIDLSFQPSSFANLGKYVSIFSLLALFIVSLTMRKQYINKASLNKVSTTHT